MFKYISLCTILLCGCITNNQKDEVLSQYDCNDLKTNEKSFQLTNDQNINVYDNNKKTNIKFNSDWYVIHRDFIKTFNENQDYIIKNLKKSNSKNKKDLQIIKYCIYAIIILVLIGMFYGRSKSK